MSKGGPAVDLDARALGHPSASKVGWDAPATLPTEGTAAGTPPMGLPSTLELDALQEATRQIAALTNALAARDRFLSVIGYELRNSVAPLILLADQLQAVANPASDPKLPSRVAVLAKHLHKFVATIDRVTEVADLRHGKLALEISCVNLANEAVEAAARMSDQALAGGVEVVVDAPTPVDGWWDRARIQQIIQNLLSNAFRYGGSGKVELTVRRADESAVLEVRDHGPGLPAHELPFVFDRLDHTFPRPSGGFGVGLFVVKALARALGGDVEVENVRDGGARFRVRLPRG